MRPSVLALLFSAALTVGATLVPVQPAVAQDGAPISVNVNMARILRLSAPATTVIIGNPGVADVTIQDSQTLVLTGRSYGQTNLIVLDSAGNPVADTVIEVVQRQAVGSVTVYQGLERQTMACAPVCQHTVTLGDAPAFSGEALASSQVIASQAGR